MKHLRFTSLLLLMLLAFVVTCKKPKSILIETGTVSNVTYTTATVQGEIIDMGEGISEHGHCWSTSPNPSIESDSKTNFGRAGKAVAFTSNLAELSSGSKYYVRAYASNGIEPSTYGEEILFKTISYGLPLVITSAVSSYTTVSAIVGGEVRSNGGAEVSESGVYWGTSEDPSSTGNKLAIGSGTGSFLTELSGLSQGTTYYIESYAVNSAGTSFGSMESFTTNLDVVEPTITTSSIVFYTAVSGIVGGDVTSNGGATVTDCGVYWGTSTNPRSTGTKLAIGNGDGSFSKELPGLIPGTTYYVEAYALNSVGTGYGGVVNFTTINAPDILQQFSYGGSSSDYLESIVQTSDGGYAGAGISGSNDGDVSGNHGGFDYWVIKTYANGQIQWERSLGGSSDDKASSIIQTSDGGYIVAGTSESNDGDISGNHGSYDYWVVKLNSTGDLQWQKSLGGTKSDNAEAIVQTSDGGYVIAGESSSNDYDVSGNHGSDDYWIVKLDSYGSLQWQKSFGGSDDDRGRSIIQSTDGGYVCVGLTYSNDGDVTGNHRYPGSTDCWVIKLNSNGDLQWQKSLGGTGSDIVNSIVQASDGGYALAGRSTSSDGDVTGNHGSSDFCVFKLASDGMLQWQKSLGGTESEEAQSIIQSEDGGYTIAGQTYSNDGDVSGSHGFADFWMVKINSIGDFQWQKTIGGSSEDVANAVIQTSDSGYVIAGECASVDGDVTVNNGYYDFWVVILK